MSALPPDAPWRGPLFLVGMPRSGTKLLRDLLNQHPRVGIPRVETEFLPDWHRRWSSFGDLSQLDAFRAFHASVQGSPYFVYMAEDEGGSATADAWHAACRSFDLPGVFEALMRLDAGLADRDDAIWGDKSPGYIRALPLLDDLFPQARLLHIVRDVRDYCLSMNTAWGKHPLRAAQRWVDAVGRAQAVGDLIGARYLELRYEDLLGDPEGALQRVCAFLGIGYLPSMTVLDRSPENLGSAKGATTIQRGNSEKWRTEMDAELREQIERMAGPLLRTFGYDCAYHGPVLRLSRTQMKAFQLADGVALVRADAKRRGWVGALRFRARMFKESGSG